jgi:flagellar operon protein
MLIPNVSRVGDKKTATIKLEKDSKLANEFKNVLKENIGQVKKNHGINLSIHAARRLQERDMSMDSNEYLKLRDAITKLKEKGGQESLVITDKAAYIVDVNGSKIITAIDKNSLAENVFTKIDSTLII